MRNRFGSTPIASAIWTRQEIVGFAPTVRMLGSATSLLHGCTALKRPLVVVSGLTERSETVKAWAATNMAASGSLTTVSALVGRAPDVIENAQRTSGREIPVGRNRPWSPARRSRGPKGADRPDGWLAPGGHRRVPLRADGWPDAAEGAPQGSHAAVADVQRAVAGGPTMSAKTMLPITRATIRAAAKASSDRCITGGSSHYGPVSHGLTRRACPHSSAAPTRRYQWLTA